MVNVRGVLWGEPAYFTAVRYNNTKTLKVPN